MNRGYRTVFVAGAGFLSPYDGVVSTFGRETHNSKQEASCGFSPCRLGIYRQRSIESEGSTINAEVILKTALPIKTALSNLSAKTRGLY